MFWIAAVVLALVGLVFVLFPLLRPLSRQKKVSRKEENLQAYQVEIDELKQTLEGGDLSQEEFHQLEKELQLRLLQDSESEEGDSGQYKKPTALVVVAAVLVMALSFGYYASHSNLKLLQLRDAMMNMFNSQQDMQHFLTLQEDYLQEYPDNLEGWFNLGRSYLEIGQASAAVQAFENALLVLERQQEVSDQDRSFIMSNLVQAQYFASQGELTDEQMRMLNQSLRFDPDNQMALALAGLIAYQQEDYATAIIRLRRLIETEQGPPEQGILNLIQGAEQALLAAGKEVPGGVSSQQSTGPVLAVSVSLSPELRDQITENAVLFILARATDGSPMPLAVKRLPASQLPMQITLSKDDAMGPMAGLEQGMNVQVVARISMSGVANPQRGDLEGFSESLVLDDGPSELNLIIDQVRN